MSIEDISRRIDAAREMVGAARAALNRAATQLDGSAAILSDTFDGSTSYEAERALELFEHARQELRDQVATLAAVEQATLDIRTRLVGTGAGTGAQAPDGSTPHTPDGPGALPPERVEQLRDGLPPPVVPNTGQRTHGRWIGPDGRVRNEVSGLDDKAQEAIRVFEEDLKSGLVPSVVTHVEIKSLPTAGGWAVARCSRVFCRQDRH